jgi:tetratricopeptide (TPR) repeat protein
LFNAEAAYADAIFRSALGDVEGSISALEGSLAVLPSYAPAILSLGSVHYQRGEQAKGRELFLSLLDLPDHTPDLCEILDEAGGFLIQAREYADGLGLYRRAAARFPRVAVLHQGLGCCAGHQGLHAEAVAASRTLVALEPDNQNFVNDLGWSLYQAGQLHEARQVLERAVAMNPADELATENLRMCTRNLHDRSTV